MCGIVGLISRYDTFPFYVDKLFTNLLRMDSIRGEDSTGVFGVDQKGHVDFLKGDTDGYLFTRTQSFEKFLKRMSSYNIVVGHNRSATIGNVTPENAHPFQKKHIILVHNGTIRNKDDLNNKVEVDSEAIAHALSEHDCVTALGKIDGAFALVWFDSKDKTLNLARNDERPLYVLEYDALFCISSEPGLPLWLAARENRKPLKVIEVPTEKIMAFALNNLSKGYFEISYEEYKHWTPATNVTESYAVIPTKRYVAPVQSKIIDLTAANNNKRNPIIKTGEPLTVILEDSKYEEGAEVVLGHPVFDGDVDKNILVRCVMPKTMTFNQVYAMLQNTNQKYRTTVQAYQVVASIPCVFVKDLIPIDEIVDGTGNVSSKSELEIALKDGCGRCKSMVSVDEIKGKGIARKRKDGTWRIVCPSCIELSIQEAQNNNPSLKLKSNG